MPMTPACCDLVLDGAISSFGFRDGISLQALGPSVALGFLQRRRLSFGLALHRTANTPWSRLSCWKPIKANLDRSAQPSRSEKEALADDDVSLSRDSMEDTVGADAKDMLNSWVGDAGSETGAKSGSSGRAGKEAFEPKEQKEIDDIEEQYLDNDKLDANESEPKNELSDARNRQAAIGSVTSSTEGGSGVESPSSVLSPSAGRDWRIWAENGGRPAWPMTETGETTSSSEASASDFEAKQVFGWSESKCDKGSLLVEGSLANAGTSNSEAKAAESSGRKDQIAERLVSLEDLVMKKDNGISAADYSRRADIFEKSNEVFTAKKKEADERNRVEV